MAGNQQDGKQMPRAVHPRELAAPGGHYSHATVANSMVFVSGQLPITRDGSDLGNAPFGAQAQQALDNVKVALECAGSGIEGLLQVRVYIDDIANWPAFNAIYAAWAGQSCPARAVLPTGPLHFGLKIEVEAVGMVLRDATGS